MSLSMGTFFGKNENPDPNSSSTNKTGMFTGASMGGLMGGPGGAVIGAGLGGVFGSNTGALRRARRTATKSSYGYAEDTFSYIGAGRAETQLTYQRELSSAKARYGASGGRTEGAAWDALVGGIVKSRDEQLDTLSGKEKEFRNTESYKWFKEDYTLLTETHASFGGSKGQRDRTVTVGPAKGHGRSGEKMFTNQQRKDMRTLEIEGGSQGNMDRKIFRDYAERVGPSLREYERGSFGSKEEKAQYKSDTDARIAKANKWYDRQLGQRKIEQANANQFYGPKDANRGSS